MTILGEIIFDMIANLEADSIGGLATGAIPIATTVATISYRKGKSIPAFWVRDERKDHGDMSEYEGLLQKGTNVVIVDDVATKGTSVLKAVDFVEKFGCKVVKVIVLLDRNEGARERFASRGLSWTYLLQKSDFDFD